VKKTDFLDDLRRLEPDELEARLDAMHKEALKRRLELGGASVKNVRLLRELRRNIARLNTVLNGKIRELSRSEG
jgi:large subunit ribosomal protein L29